MALNRSNKYPGRFLPPTTARPQGAFKNRTSPTAQDGSFLEADWANDWDGFFARLLNVAGVSPNGNVDNGTTSQLFDAMIASVKANLGNAALRTVGNSTNQIPDMSYFQSSISGNGWRMGPDGIIEQWGIVTFNSSTTTLVANLPRPFPTNILHAMAVDTGPSCCGAGVQATSATQITVYAPAYYINTAGNIVTRPNGFSFRYRAIGY